VAWQSADAAPVVWTTMADATRRLRTAEMAGPAYLRRRRHHQWAPAVRVVARRSRTA